MNFFNKIPVLNKMGRTALFITMFVLILGISILTSFQPLFGNIPFNIIFPICCIVGCKMVRFERVKICTLLIMRVLIVVVVLGEMFPSIQLINTSLYVNLVLVFLIINILEATITDF